LAVDAGERSGRLVAELQSVGKAWSSGQWVVRGLETVVQRGDRIGLIGPNGAGKTTLLRLILGELTPDEGRVKIGTALQVAYFDQLRQQLDEQAAVVDTISPGSEWVEIGGKRTHVMSYLGRFLFAPERARSPVKSLSGGERNRLLLARLFARPANLLVMDEPTNDLDIETLELLEELLTEYPGTVLLVSHDRAFLDAVVTQCLVFEGEGRWTEYAGGYRDVVAAQDRRAADLAALSGRQGGGEPGGDRAEARLAVSIGARAGRGDDGAARSNPPSQRSSPAAGSVASGGAPARTKLSYKEQRELDELPARIEILEQEQKNLGERISDPNTYSASPDQVNDLHSRFADIESALLQLLDRWAELEARQR
jgi:ATP-binding cassette subfamily F protein uup